MRTLYDRLRKIPPAGVLFGMAVAALLLLLANFGAQTATTTYPVGGVVRRVGFASAVNWTLGFIIVVPAAMYFIASAFRTAERLPERLIDAHMALDSAGQPMRNGAKKLRNEWHRLLEIASIAAAILIPIGIIACIGEWWAYSGGPLLGGKPLPDEQDWSVAAALSAASPAASPWPNALASLFAFIMQAAFLASLLLFLGFLFAFCELVRRLADRDEEPVLMLDVRSDDRRRGFQIFEGIIEQVLIACASGFTLFYLSRLWNLYLEDETSPSLYAFVITDILRGTNREKPEITQLLLDIGGWEYSSIWVTLGSLILFVLCVLIPLYVLRRAALQARDSLITAIDNGTAVILEEMPAEEAKKRARDLAVWPLGYPKANQLILLGALAFLSMFFFRIGLFYLGMILAWLIFKGYKALSSDK